MSFSYFSIKMFQNDAVFLLGQRFYKKDLTYLFETKNYGKD